MLWLRQTIPGIVLLAVGGLSLCGAVILQIHSSRKQHNRFMQSLRLERRYDGMPVSEWEPEAQRYADSVAAYNRAVQAYEETAGALEQESRQLQQEILEFTEGKSLTERGQELQKALDTRRRLREAERELERATQVAEALAIPFMEEPNEPDTLEYTRQEAEQLLEETRQQLQTLQLRTGRLQGQMEKLGSREILDTELRNQQARVRELKRLEAALTIARETCAQATGELQRRFAPRISQRARELMAQLTGGRYDRLQLDENMELHTGARGEDTLHTALWRSDGTTDQLYLALRLAVAAEITPEAPLILDDALVRFDAERLKAALRILKAQDKQVLLFSCPDREEQILKSL